MSSTRIRNRSRGSATGKRSLKRLDNPVRIQFPQTTQVSERTLTLKTGTAIQTQPHHPGLRRKWRGEIRRRRAEHRDHPSSTAQAMCMSPESLQTTSSARASRSTASVESGAARQIDDADRHQLFDFPTRRLSHRENRAAIPGVHAPRRLRATAAKCCAGQRLAGPNSAPGHRSR